MDLYINRFIDYLADEKLMAKNSLDAYRRDTNEFRIFLSERGINSPVSVQKTDVSDYISSLVKEGRAGSTVNRKVASLRAFGRYLYTSGVIKDNIMIGIKAPRVDRKGIEYLTIGEVEAILSAPDKSIKGVRDKAILELLYATGIRVTEVTEMHVEDANLNIGYITCTGAFGKARIIPIGKMCRKALSDYINNSRMQLINGGGRGLREKPFDMPEQDTNILFVNFYGDKLTRQGLWKIIKQYAEKAGIEAKLTPQILRNSFAVHMIQNGADLKSLQELMGHEDLSTTHAYLETTHNRIKEVYDRSHPRSGK